MTQPSVEAGFPSPAADYTDQGLNLHQLVVKRPAATFFMRVVGSSMLDAGITDGDLLAVDRSIEPREGDIVVAAVGDGFACKRLTKRGKRWALTSDGDGPTITVDEEQGIEIFGVATWTLKSLCNR